VFWDQRGHGRSGRRASDRVSIGQLGADLHTVLLAVAPGASPVVLVGHSMGGMTVLALAREHPELFGTKIIGSVLISSAATGVDPAAWLPAPVRLAVRQTAPAVLRGAARSRPAALIERARGAASDLAFLGTRYMAFGDSRQVSPAVVDFLERMIRATPVEVVAEFYLALLEHDQQGALAAMGRVPVTVVAGERDRLIGAALAEQLAAGIPGARLITLPETGHVALLERPAAVNEAITGLVTEALGTGPAGGHPRRREAGA
jgi:pimeloyl-ACP methyl ester carboxylesterase